MTTIVGIVGGWFALNVALAVALLMRRDRPEARAKLMAWGAQGRAAPEPHDAGAAGPVEARNFFRAGARVLPGG
jgi:hypothetical protein